MIVKLSELVRAQSELNTPQARPKMPCIGSSREHSYPGGTLKLSLLISVSVRATHNVHAICRYLDCRVQSFCPFLNVEDMVAV